MLGYQLRVGPLSGSHISRGAMLTKLIDDADRAIDKAAIQRAKEVLRSGREERFHPSERKIPTVGKNGLLEDYTGL